MRLPRLLLFLCGCYLLTGTSYALLPRLPLYYQEVTADPTSDSPSAAEPVAHFAFDGTIGNATDISVDGVMTGTAVFVEGLDEQALSLGSTDSPTFLTVDRENLPFDSSSDFSVQFWVRTVADSDKRFVVLSQKAFNDNSLASQKQPGWVFYVSGGTWAWNMGTGTRRVTYERANGAHMPLNDGRWHQLAMTYSSERSEIRLFYDGVNKATYHVNDSGGFDFTATSPLVVGWDGARTDVEPAILPIIEAGAEQLQQLVDTFNGFGLKEVQPEEFASLIVDPRGLFDQKLAEVADLLGTTRAAFLESMEAVDFEPIKELEAALMKNPYTVHQAMSFMEAGPLLKIYSLVDGKVTIDPHAASVFAERERLYPPDFDMDNFAIWDRVLTPEEVLASYAEYFKPAVPELPEERTSLTAAVWNIFHGGLHFTIEDHGWDSRMAIAELLKRENADVVLMQETYSAGDFIAAELGYYFATTVDWDNLNQGANISVLSRYPIKELHVPEEASFMNVAAKLAVSQTQDLYAMSNWYGMRQFPTVFAYHESRFQESDTIPTLFGGDFNAIPDTDGGDNLAWRTLQDAGFTDAFRSLYPDVETHPGYTHRGRREERRIDQLYYKGAGLKNTSTKVISTWPTGFPSDHYLILSTFDLNYSTRDAGQRP